MPNRAKKMKKAFQTISCTHSSQLTVIGDDAFHKEKFASSCRMSLLQNDRGQEKTKSAL
jgi:hypothetical protein